MFDRLMISAYAVYVVPLRLFFADLREVIRFTRSLFK